MSKTYWQPKAVAVAQVATVEVTAYDAATTYKLTVNGFTVQAVGVTSTTATAAALAAAWNASTHPYFAYVTAANNASATVTLTGDVAGVPFTATAAVTGGTGTIGAFTVATAATSLYDWGNASNWSGGAVPADNDEVYIADSAYSILWGLSQSSVALNLLQIDRSFTGKIGLNGRVFATSADGETTVSTAVEYRQAYLAIGADVVNAGQNFGQDVPAGSGRIMLDLGSDASQVTVHGTAQASSDTGRPAFRLLANSASTDVFVRSAPGGFGIAVENPGEVSTVGDIVISDTSSSTKAHIGAGVTMTSYAQSGGVNVLEAAATIATVTVTGGTLTTEGDYTITAMAVNAGIVYSNHTKSAGNCITMLTLTGGQVYTTGNGVARTIDAVVLGTDGTIVANSATTLTGITLPTAPYRVTLAKA